MNAPGYVRDAASSKVWDLVSGLPSSERTKRRMMALQAYFDDSKEAGRVVVLAGLIAPAEQWAAFSDEWKGMLTLRRNWLYFKMSEWVYSEDEEVWEKIKFPYRIIERRTSVRYVVLLILPC
jgi:hypothetical protein